MMAERFDSRARQANTRLALHHSISMIGTGLTQAFSTVLRFGHKTLRISGLFCLLVFLLPLFLILTKDWICVLVVVHAFTAAVRLQNAPVARTLSACSSTTVPSSAVEGEYRAFR